MGRYLNIGNEAFRRARNSEYVDKSGLIAVVNGTLFTERSYSCVSRSRRFGKSVAAAMLAAYYDRTCDSRSLFADLKIAGDPSFEQHLNKYPVIYLDLTDFTTRYHDGDIVTYVDAALRQDIGKAYPQVPAQEGDDLMDLLMRIYEVIGERFVFIIDEWDAICREFRPETRAMDNYVNWLRRMFKSISGKLVFAGVYMTGILPIKKYNTQSALNNFIEYSVVEPGGMASSFGFTKDEVKALASKHNMDFDELEKWYDGYQIGDEVSIFNPNSVMQAIRSRRCRSYWASTSAFDSVADYIQMNYEGLKDDAIKMLAGERIKVDPTGFGNDMNEISSKDDVLTVLIHLGYLSYDWRRDECWIPNREVAGERCLVDPTGFQNDMSVVRTRDDVLTVLIHLGYLSYDWDKEECYIPNREVAGEMVNAVKANNWKPVVDALQKSEQLLRDTLDGDAEAVAKGIEAAHDENTSILSYNNENSLACVLSIAYYYARNDYVMDRELATGKGFADIVLIPRKNVDSPAIVIELKVNKDADAAIDQIRRRQYPEKIRQHADRLILVGINYDRETKQHTCQILFQQQQ